MKTSDIDVIAATQTTVIQGFKESVIQFRVKATLKKNNLIQSIFGDIFKITITCKESSYITTTVQEKLSTHS